MSGTVDRREFLTISVAASAGLLLGCRIGREEYSRGAGELAAWVHVGTDDVVTIYVSEAEMGQGVMTAFAQILADEMEADWTNVRAMHAPADGDRFGWQSTGGSTSIRLGYESLRDAGAAAREMLVSAAAERWNVPARQCAAVRGRVLHEPSGRSATYGELAERASALPQPRRPRRKQPSDFRYMGKPLKRLDSPPKVDGTAVFGLDVRLPDMLVAVVAHPPVFGGAVRSFDAAAARQVPGVREVVEIPTGIAVVADGFWAAQAGRRALMVDWDDGGWGGTSSDDIWATLEERCPHGAAVETFGSPEHAMEQATRRVRAVYRAPYLAHATMEPMNCVAHVRPDACEIWVGTQSQTRCQDTAAEIAGLRPEQVTIHTMYLGGGFGRRANAEIVAEAVHVSKAVGRAVKVLYTRADDMRRGWYRPVSYNDLEAALDDDGWPTAWIHRIAGAGGADGSSNMRYQFRNHLVTLARERLPVTTWQWRAVDNTQNCYVIECFMDEVARAGGKDALELRLRYLGGHPRERGVLEVAADRAGWGTALPVGRARGIAMSACFGSYIAQVAEVSLADDGRPLVHRVVCAIDCGTFINPDTIRGQMESGIIFGLSAALYGQITIENGGAVQGNYHDYRIVRMHETPTIETHIVESGEAPGGIGELGTPPIVPAVCNAILALTGEPVRSLPITRT